MNSANMYKNSSAFIKTPEGKNALLVFSQRSLENNGLQVASVATSTGSNLGDAWHGKQQRLLLGDLSAHLEPLGNK